jgi:hypothetical protein
VVHKRVNVREISGKLFSNFALSKDPERPTAGAQKEKFGREETAELMRQLVIGT